MALGNNLIAIAFHCESLPASNKIIFYPCPSNLNKFLPIHHKQVKLQQFNPCNINSPQKFSVINLLQPCIPQRFSSAPKKLTLAIENTCR
mmetsp:Transcript_10779/g.13363  ORF Transcript_10779/g.13363 Transcript_10779/m.13363 type:complete len:90 (-) Transcript_10779:367-636(-)